MSETDPRRLKLFPRNLTAKAERVIRGNPVTSRPEDGVDNCFPGLEFDHRNLDTVFFPGLVFEFHAPDGALVRRAHGAALPMEATPTQADIDTGLFMFWVGGTVAGKPADFANAGVRSLFDVRPLGDLDVWRVVRDLEPGPICVVLAPNRLIAASRGAGFINFVDGVVRSGTTSVIRDAAGNWQIGILFGERARFLKEGVIAPDLVHPGDLTRSLCSPWQYDFADCGCFYWASNKPDMVASPKQAQQILNFQRRDRDNDAAAVPIVDSPTWEGRDGMTLNHAGMIAQWETLPFVVAERETDRFVPRPPPQPDKILDRATIIERLRYLATVEHALCTEYLYAFYSLKTPRERPEIGETDAGRIFTAADEVFRVAVDEMRHLRLVNEILVRLGEEPVLARAEVIGRDVDMDCKSFDKPFALVPLTPDQLQWFIDVERPSQDFDPTGDQDTIDGMYTRILLSIQHGSEFPDKERDQLIHLVKIIIDEGIDHFVRFQRAQSALDGLAPEDYLLFMATDPEPLPANHPLKEVQDLADANYTVVLRTLDFVFQQDDAQRGQMLEAARRAMFNLDDSCRLLAVNGVPPLFSLPPQQVAQPVSRALGLEAMSMGHASLRDALEEVVAPAQAAMRPLEQTQSEQFRALTGRIMTRIEDMKRDFTILLDIKG